MIACCCQTKPDARLTSLSGTHCGSFSEKGLLKAPFSGTMRRPLELRTSFFPSGTEDIFLRCVSPLCSAESPSTTNSHLDTPFRMIDRPFNESERTLEITCFFGKVECFGLKSTLIEAAWCCYFSFQLFNLDASARLSAVKLNWISHGPKMPLKTPSLYI